MNFLRKYLRNEKGSTAVEFGMVSIMFLVVLFGIIELSRIYWTWNTLQYATEATARYAMANQDATNADLVTYAGDSMSGIQVDISALTVVTTLTTIGGVSFIEVDSSYLFTTMFPLLPAEMSGITLRSQSRMPYSL